MGTASSPSWSATRTAASTMASGDNSGLGPRRPRSRRPHNRSSPGGRAGVLWPGSWSPRFDPLTLLTITVYDAYSDVYGIYSSIVRYQQGLRRQSSARRGGPGHRDRVSLRPAWPERGRQDDDGA